MTARARQIGPPARLPDPSEVINVLDAQHHGEGKRLQRRKRYDVPMLDVQPMQTVGWAEIHGMDLWLDHLETLSRAFSQRRMTADQRERLYGLLERIYTDARQRRKAARA